MGRERYGWGSALICGACAACAGSPTTNDPPPTRSPAQNAAGAASQPVSNPAPANPTGTPGANSATPIIPITPSTPTATCRPGHYVGSFSGMYFSGALAGAAEITFATSDVDNRPGFEFWLEAADKVCAPGQEFCGDVVVKGGKLRGQATPFADANDPSTQGGLGFSVRFEIDLTGELDCQAKKFKGQLVNGCYDVFSILYRFAGSIEGDYDVSMSAFTSGVWDVVEMTMADALPPAMPLGGDGVWSAAYVDDAALPTDGPVGLCSGMSGFDTQP